MDEKNGRRLSVLHVGKRGIFRLGFQNLGETLLGVLSATATLWCRDELATMNWSGFMTKLCAAGVRLNAQQEPSHSRATETAGEATSVHSCVSPCCTSTNRMEVH